MKLPVFKYLTTISDLISDFRREVYENFALLDYDEAGSGNFLPIDCSETRFLRAQKIALIFDIIHLKKYY
jgi:hypothetical protein